MSDDSGSRCLLWLVAVAALLNACDNAGDLRRLRAELDDHVGARCTQLSEETIDEIFITGMNTPLTQGEDNE